MAFLSVHPSDLETTHQANLLRLLARRLEVAKAHHDQSLVSALEYEYQQLTAPDPSMSISARLQQLWLNFAETLSNWTKVHIEQTVNAKGKPSWYAYNPQSGQTIHTESQAEMHQWIKRTYWNR
jgi:hypothetical protein